MDDVVQVQRLQALVARRLRRRPGDRRWKEYTVHVPG